MAAGRAPLTQQTRIPGESRDPRFKSSIGGLVDPGFRRECGSSQRWFDLAAVPA